MKILVCYRGPVDPDNLLQTALSYALSFKATVILVTSLEKSEALDQEKVARTKSYLDKARSFFEEHGVQCLTEILAYGGGSGEDIVIYAMKNEVDLIIIGIIKKSKVGKLLFGSTAQYVILKADCPVLSVK